MSDLRRDDAFESALRADLRRRSRPNEQDLDELLRLASNLPPRQRGSSWAVWPAIAAVVTVVVVGALAVGFGRLGPGATSTDTPPATAISTASPVHPTVTPGQSLADAAEWAGDPRLADCAKGGSEQVRLLTAYEFTHASDYQVRLPALGFRAELERSDPALVLVFADVSPVDVPLQFVGPPQVHEPIPGTHDICVGLLASGSTLHWRYTDLAIDFAYLSGAATPSPRPSTSRVLGNLQPFFRLYGTNLVWDQSSKALWYAYVGCAEEKSSIYRLDPVTGKTQSWAIPSNAAGNCQASRAQMDASGALWIMESSWLVRFDTTMQTMKQVRVAPAADSPPTAPTGMAVDGTSVLVARANTASLTRVDAAMRVSTIPISKDLAVAQGDRVSLAVGGGAIYLVKEEVLHVLGLNGSEATTSRPSGREVSARPDGSVVLWSDNGTGAIANSAGIVGEQVTTPAEAGVAPATDWQGRFWYVDYAAGAVVVEIAPA